MNKSKIIKGKKWKLNSIKYVNKIAMTKLKVEVTSLEPVTLSTGLAHTLLFGDFMSTLISLFT